MRAFVILALALAGGPTLAQSTTPADHLAHHPASAASPAAANPADAFADGEVRRVDRDAQKVTLRHGPLPSLGMPEGMTMVFRVSDPKMLDGLKAGDKVQFKADKVGGQYTVTEIRAAK